MTFPYNQVFQQLERALMACGSRRRPVREIRAELDVYKAYAGRELTDDEYFTTLVFVVFYSGFRASTVSQRAEAINRWFPNLRTAADYGTEEVRAMMADPGMIRHEQKILACIANAQAMRRIIVDHGSMGRYITSFAPRESLENLLLLKEELEARFSYLGGITVYHFLTDIGLPVLKPDRVICRIFQRLGLLEHEKQLLKAVLQGRRFAEATGLPMRYIDIVFVAYGQVQTEEFGIDRGICLSEPRCGECGVREFCRWDGVGG